MSTPDQTDAPARAQDAAALARFAGIPMPEERLPRFAADLTTAQELIRDLDTVPVGASAPTGTGFDPVWTARTGETTR